MDATSGVTIERLPYEQSAAAVHLSEEAGWNQRDADWRLMLIEGRGFGVRDATGRWIASALVLPVGPRFAWVSMVLVTAAHRRRGLGTALLRRSFAEVEALGRVAALDATELGRPLYLPLGFRDVVGLRRWRLERPVAPAAPSEGIRVAPLELHDLPPVLEMDRRRTGVERGAVLLHLANRMPSLAHVARDRDDRLLGFVLGRDGRVATQLGPLIAQTPAAAAALLAAASAAHPPPFFVDVVDGHGSFQALLQASGATAPRGFTRMTRGDPGPLADMSALFAVIGPEFG